MTRTTAGVFAAVLLLVPTFATAQVHVLSPQPGAASSYKKTVITWQPIPGASSYHLQIDDDPAFGSPEVDVVVNQPSYALTRERLRLNGQVSWAAYVRINGQRWRAAAFTPSYIPQVAWPELAVDLDGRVHYAYLSNPFGESQAFLRTSTDWSAPRQLSPAVTDGNPADLAVGVDRFGTFHAFWTEQLLGQLAVPFYTNSSTWIPSQIGNSVGLGGAYDVGPSMLLTDTAIEIFNEAFGPVQRFTSTDSVAFTSSSVPNSGFTASVHGVLAPSGDMLLVESRIDRGIYLQTSHDNWSSSTLIGRGRYPTIAVGENGVAHVLKREELSGLVSYSNTARAFATWTPLPLPPVIGQQLLPIVTEDGSNKVYMAAPFSDGVRVCAVESAGDEWACSKIGMIEGSHPDLKVDTSGILHIAWSDALGGGYANSLGSFLAVNLPPAARFAPPIYSTQAVTIDTTVADADGDGVLGSVSVGQSFDDRAVFSSNDSFPMLGDQVVNSGDVGLLAANRTLLFRLADGNWRTSLSATDLTALPVRVDVVTLDRRLVDSFTIEAWNFTGITINRRGFIPYVGEAFVGPWLPPLALTLAPQGPLTLRVSVSDGTSVRIFDKPFIHSSGQRLLVFRR